MTEICKTCNSHGVTNETRPVIKTVDKKPTTIKQGSGCPDCLGLGIKGERDERKAS